METVTVNKLMQYITYVLNVLKSTLEMSDRTAMISKSCILLWDYYVFTIKYVCVHIYVALVLAVASNIL